MSEHLIRFRGGWLSLDQETPAGQPDTASRPIVTLPTTWPGQGGSGRDVRLVRSFAPPPLDPDHERLALRLTDVQGLVSISLNGAEIARPAPGTSALEVALPFPLPPRNLLMLDVAIVSAGTGVGVLPRPWGEIALVIASDEPSADALRQAACGETSGKRPTENEDDLLGGTGPRA